VGEKDEEGALSVETEERVAKPRGRWRKYVIFLFGFGIGSTLTVGALMIAAANAIFADRDYSNSAAELSDNPEVQAGAKLSLERLLGARLPESAHVTMWQEFGWQEMWLTAVFQTNEADGAALAARLDEIRTALTDAEVQKLQSFGKDHVDRPIRKPIRAWMLPRHADMQILVVRLAEIRDGKAIWVVEDHLG
jgi:hypothetical protein